MLVAAALLTLRFDSTGFEPAMAGIYRYDGAESPLVVIDSQKAVTFGSKTYYEWEEAHSAP